MSSDDIIEDMEKNLLESANIVEDVEDLLRSAANDGKWLEVLKMYKENKDLRMVSITATGDTVLHMAVSSGEVYRVECMVDLVCEKRIIKQDGISAVSENDNEKKRVLGAENEKGNTPLHLAASASKGSAEMCKKISNAEPSLITRYNKVGETPLFMAALHGNKEAFVWLYDLKPQSPSSGDAHYKRDNNDTILHCALAGGHIDLAIDIVLLYKRNLKVMTMMRNKNGLSPLHLLAATPSTFESTSLPSRSFVVQLLYHWFFRVKEKEQATTREELEHERKPRVDALMEKLVEYGSFAENFAEGLPCCISSIWLLIVFPLRLFGWVMLISLLVLKILLLPAKWLLQNWFREIQKMKEKHIWSLQIMKILLRQLVSEEDESIIISRILLPSTAPETKDNEAESKIVDPPLMIAAKNGVIEMVEKILQKFPSRMNVMNIVDDEGKNIVLLAVEKRQTKLYQFLCGYGYLDNAAFGQVDKDGNTALHLAAKLGINLNWQTTTMVEEFKWFEFVKSSVPSDLWEKYNNDGKTAEEIFRDSYKEHMTSDRQWLNQTSQTCSVASTLIAAMAFSNFAGENLHKKNNSSLVALSLSLTSTISFLAILAFRSQSFNFWRYAPFILQLAILTMFGSIVSLWISLMLHNHSITACAILGSPIAILTIVSLPIFIGRTLMSILTKVPPPNSNTTSAIHYQRPQKKEK